MPSPSTSNLRQRIRDYIGDAFSRAARKASGPEPVPHRRPLNTTVCPLQFGELQRLSKDSGVPRSRLIDKVLEEGIPLVRRVLGLQRGESRE